MFLLLGTILFSGCSSSGTQWYTGTETPTSSVGSNGDFYYDTDDYILYQKANGYWTVLMRNFGKSGEDATANEIEIAVNDDVIQWRYTSGDDTSWKTLIALEYLTGANGDDGREIVFQVTDEYIQYQYVGDTEWINLMQLSAIQGTSGATWISGSFDLDTLNSASIGSDGDFYLNTSTYDIFKKTDGTWEQIGNIKGEDANNDEVNEKLEELENLINNGSIDITRLSNYQTETVYNKYDLIDDDFAWKNNYYISATTGGFGGNTAYYCTEDYIPVTPGETYVFFADYTAVSIVHMAFYDEVQGYVSGTTSSMKIVTIPDNCYYIRFSVNKSSSLGFDEENNIPDAASVEFYNQSSTVYSTPTVVAEIAGLDADTLLIDGSISAEKCDFFTKYASPNILDTVIPDSYWATTSSKTATNTVYVVLNQMAVTEGYIVNVWKGSSKLQMRFVTAFDSTGALISKTAVDGTNANTTDYTVPTGTAYVAITIYTSAYEEDKIQVQCTSDGQYLGKYYTPGIYYYYLNEDYYYFVESSSAHYYLPSEICVATGVTIDLYNEQIVLEADDYHFQWVASIGSGSFGRAYERLFRMTGTSELEGLTGTLTLNLYDDDLELQYTATATVKFVSATISEDQLIIPIGDSLTNSKPWLSSVNTLSDGKITFRGTQGVGSKSNTTTMSHEGRSGAGTGWYNANSTYTYNVTSTNTTLDISQDSDGTNYTTNPFWNPDTDAFDFDYYCNSEADGGAGYFQDSEGNDISITPTGVMIYLGTNGISLDASTAVTNITTLINNIRNSTKGANIVIYVVNTIFRPTQIFSETSDGYTTNTTGEFSYRADMKVMNLEIGLYEALCNMENVVIVPVAATMDREYNFPYEEVAVNPYSTETMKSYTDCVHPSDAGYYQMADIMFSTIAAHYQVTETE